MAKKENKLTYLQMPLPNGRKSYRMTKRSWSGLNYRQKIDTGALSMEYNISTLEAPYLTPSPKWAEQTYTYVADHEKSTTYGENGTTLLGIFGFNDFLLVIYRKNKTIYADYIQKNRFVHTGVIGEALTTDASDEPQRSVVQFNVYDTPTDPMRGEYIRKLLIFPDKVSMYMNISDTIHYGADDDPADWKEDTVATKEKGVLYCHKINTNCTYWMVGTDDTDDTKVKMIRMIGDPDDPYPDDTFPIDKMDVTVKAYYNDGSSDDEDIKTEATISSMKLTQRKGDKKINEDKYEGLRDVDVKFTTANCIGKMFAIYKFNDIDGTWVLAMGGKIKKNTETYTIEFDSYKKYSVMLKIYTDNDDASQYITKQRKITLSNELSGDSGEEEPDEERTSEGDYFPPGKNANTSYYYFNTYNSKTYRYCEYDTEDGNKEYGWKESVPPNVPDLNHVTVHLSRVFGVDGARVYASGFNDYCNWNIDTVGEANESNAWCSPSQSKSQADGEFTGITAYQGHIICFKRDYMHEIYNTSNPFRLVDVFAEGTIDHRTIQEVNGRLFFVADNGVKIYSGSRPSEMGFPLNISNYRYAVSGSDDRCYYLYCEDDDKDGEPHLFVYDTYVEQWSEQGVVNRIVGFAKNKNGMYFLDYGGRLCKMTNNFSNHSWRFETDLITNQTVDIKHIKKLQMFADIGENAWIKVYMLYDDEVFNENTSHLVYDSSGRTGQSAIRVKPRMTANYGVKLHVEGVGYVRLYEMELFIENGGGLYVGN